MLSELASQARRSVSPTNHVGAPPAPQPLKIRRYFPDADIVDYLREQQMQVEPDAIACAINANLDLVTARMRRLVQRQVVKPINIQGGRAVAYVVRGDK